MSVVKKFWACLQALSSHLIYESLPFDALQLYFITQLPASQQMSLRHFSQKFVLCTNTESLGNAIYSSSSPGHSQCIVAYYRL